MLPNTASGEISLSKTEKYFKGEMSVFAECLEELGPELMEGRGRERDPNRPSPALGSTAPIAARCRFRGEAAFREMKTRPPRPCQSSPARQAPVKLREPSVWTA